MKRINWFISLSYPDFDILFPKEDILASNYIKEDLGEDKKIINFDSLINPLKNADDSLQSGGKNKTQLEVKGEENIILQTSIIPDLVSANLLEFRVFGDALGKTLLKQGFISTRFIDKKIQYLIDIKAIIKNI